MTPCGLGARDTLRLEVCFHLHGNDMGPDRNPIEAGLGWCCKEETGFAGSEPIAAARADGTAEKLVAFAIDGKGIPRAGNDDPRRGRARGRRDERYLLAFARRIGIGMGYVRAELADPGQSIEIDVRGRVRDAEIRPKPLYAKS